MQLKKVETNFQIAELVPGDTFRYPRGEAIYLVCEPVGNLKGLYTTGRTSKKKKIWATSLGSGLTAAVDFDTPVIKITSELRYRA